LSNICKKYSLVKETKLLSKQTVFVVIPGRLNSLVRWQSWKTHTKDLYNLREQP